MEMRIISLIASATEMVCALGLADKLVGCSHECDYPKEVVKNLPVCTYPKFDPNKSSKEIDDQVKTVLQKALSVYGVDGEMLAKLAPTHIITQDQCEVCAVSLSDVEQVLCNIISSRPKIISLKPNSLDDIWQDFVNVGIALEVEDTVKSTIDGYKKRINYIADRTDFLLNKPTVICIEWIEPLMAAGNWVPELVELAGGINLLGETGKHSPKIVFDDLINLNPDIILVMPCGFDMKKTWEEMHFLSENAAWPKIKAVKENQVYITDGNQFFNRPGPRIVESLEIMAEIFHPKLFNYGHIDKGWQQKP
jgi:iron complex transport system substrate-binding protein